MRTSEELKQLLIEIRDNDYNVPDGTDVDSIIADMLKFIGHTDAELRDKLIEKTFMQWGEYKGIISPEKMKEILGVCLSNTHLFYGIGENGTDSVFTRSFSSLVVSVAFCMQDEKPFLSAEEVNKIKETVLHYISLEKDYRGYVDGKGWAHAVAHIADALYNIVGCGKVIDIDGEGFSVGRNGMLEVLEAIKKLACNKALVYDANDDERLADATMVVIWRKLLTNSEIIAWLDSLNMKDSEYWKGTMPYDCYLHVNRKNFMRSLYFKLLADGNYEEICKFMLGFLVESDD